MVEKDDYHILSEEEQVVLPRFCSGHNRLNDHMATNMRLLSGHNRLNDHMATNMRLLSPPLCAWGLENQTDQQILQRRLSYGTLRMTHWPLETPADQAP